MESRHQIRDERDTYRQKLQDIQIETSKIEYKILWQFDCMFKISSF